MDLSGELTREGVRGGREQFKWDSLKGQRNRERQHYLGVTAKLGVSARFGRYNTNDWWRSETGGSQGSSSAQTEKSAVNDIEKQLMMEALGVKPKRLMLVKHDINTNEVEDIVTKQEGVKSHSEPEKPIQQIPQGQQIPIEGMDDSRMVTGLGYRKYLKPTDWSTTAYDLDGEEEVLAPIGEMIKQEKSQVKREYFPQRPTIKEEIDTEPAKQEQTRSTSVPRSERVRSRSRDIYRSQRAIRKRDSHYMFGIVRQQ
jgi:hypothetical protein